jgi:hypothetical protein
MDPDKTVMVWEWKGSKKGDALCKVSLKTAKIFSLGTCLCTHTRLPRSPLLDASPFPL